MHHSGFRVTHSPEGFTWEVRMDRSFAERLAGMPEPQFQATMNLYLDDCEGDLFTIKRMP